MRAATSPVQNADLQTNQLTQKTFLTGVLPEAHDLLSTTTGWLRVVRLLPSTVICNGMETAHKRPQFDFQSHTQNQIDI